MSHGAEIEPVKVVQAGATGVVAEMFRDVIARSDIPFELEAVATAAHPELHHKTLGEAKLACPPSMEDVPIISLTSAIESADAPLFFSGLQAKMAARYERRMSAGRLLVTNASANRDKPDVPLVSPFINPGQIDELFARTHDAEGNGIEGRIVAGGNCMSAIMSVPLAPIHREIGIESMSVRTMQGWSGAGYKKLPEDSGGTPPVTGDEQEKLMTEPNHFLGTAIDEPAGILIGAEPRRGPWLRGHHARIALNLSRDTTEEEVDELMRGFKAPAELNDVRAQIRAITKAGQGHRWPGRYSFKPIKVEHGSLLHTGSDDTPRLHGVQPMRVLAHILEFDPEDPARIVIEVAGDNLIQGAVGGNILNAIYARLQGYLD